MFSINFNNLNSRIDIGLSIQHRPAIPIPERDINVIPIQGRENGSLTQNFNSYKDIEIPISFNIVDRTNINDSARIIRGWLCGDIQDDKLIFSDDEGYYYKVKYIKLDKNMERSLRVLGRFTATFTCEPFCYCIGTNMITITNNPTTIYNTTTNSSNPVMKIYGIGSVTIFINSKSFIISNITDYITIDSEMKDCYKDTQLKNNDMSGDFPILSIGNNNISWTGNVTKIEITPNFNYL